MAAPATRRIIRILLALFVALAALKATYSLWRIVSSSAPDFAYYYQAAQEATQRVISPIHLLPPASLLLFAPLQLIPFAVSQAIWVLVSFGCLIMIGIYLARSAGMYKALDIGVILAFSYLAFPTQFTLGMGQVNFIALFLIVASVALEERRYPMLSGILMGISWLFKPEFILLLPVIVLGRRWKMLWGSLGTLGVAVGVSLLYWGRESYIEYANRMMPAASGFRDAGIYYNQSLTGLLTRAGLVSPVLPVAVGVLLMLFACMLLIRKKQQTFAHSVWMFFPALLLMEPIAWQHHFVVLIPTFITLWTIRKRWRQRATLAVSYFLVSWNFASSGFLDTMPLGWLIASHVGIGTLLVWWQTL